MILSVILVLLWRNGGADPGLPSRVAAAVSHVRRLHTTYYIKAEGEVNFAFVRDNAIHPVEVKWAGCETLPCKQAL